MKKIIKRSIIVLGVITIMAIRLATFSVNKATEVSSIDPPDPRSSINVCLIDPPDPRIIITTDAIDPPDPR